MTFNPEIEKIYLIQIDINDRLQKRMLASKRLTNVKEK